MIDLYFDVIPRAKERPRFYNGRAVTSGKTRQFEKSLRLEARLKYTGQPLEGPLRCEMEFIFPVPSSRTKSFKKACLEGCEPHQIKPDLDNLAKVKDAMNGIIWKDDSQIAVERLSKSYESKTKKTGIYIRVSQL